MDRFFIKTKAAMNNNHLEGIYGSFEQQQKNHITAFHGTGIIEGLEVAQNSPTPDMNVLVAAGRALDPTGWHVQVDSQQTVDCSVDEGSNPTVPTSPGWERYISIMLRFDWSKSTPVEDLIGWPDPDGQISLEWDHGFLLAVKAGTQATTGTAVKPTVASDEVLLADILLPYGTTAITTAMIDTARRSPILELNGHLSADPAHAASKISFDNSTANLDGSPTRVQAAIEALAAGMRFRGMVVFTSSGTFTQGVNCPSDITKFIVDVYGGGAPGGGTTTTGKAGGGGGGGEWRRAEVTLTKGEAVSATVGLGGLGVAGADATNGQASSFGSYCTAMGGTRGTLATDSSFTPGGAGGTGGSGGEISVPGQDGGKMAYDAGAAQGGAAGGPFGGAGGIDSIVASTGGNGFPGQLFGGGGSGAHQSTGSSNWAGGDGADGVIIITW